VWGSLVVPETVRGALASVDGPTLLVDDQVDTGWTITVAALLLRQAGASAVLPFALAVT
jgi:ATP-dependent DNA helicase RecQ